MAAKTAERTGYLVLQYLPNASRPRTIPLGLLAFHGTDAAWKLGFIRRDEGSLALAREHALSDAHRVALKDIEDFLTRSVQLVMTRKQPRTMEQLLGHLAAAIAFNFTLSDVFERRDEAEALQEKLYKVWSQRQERPLFNRALIPA